MLIEVSEYIHKTDIKIDERELKDFNDKELLELIISLLSNPKNIDRNALEDLLIGSLLITDCKIIEEKFNNGEYFTLFDINH